MHREKGLLYKAVEDFLQCPQIRILVFMTSLAGIGNLSIGQGILREQGHENVGVGIPRFGALGDSRHVATDAVREGMNRMGQIVVDHLMAFQTLS